MDEIEKRLRDSADSCIKNYEAWRAKEKDAAVREALMESIHEVRKVASRLEIEMAISERGDMANKPIPIPPHRSSKRGRGNGNGNAEAEGNGFDAGESDKPPTEKRPSRGRRQSNRNQNSN